MKKIFALIVAILFLVSIMPVYAYEDDERELALDVMDKHGEKPDVLSSKGVPSIKPKLKSRLENTKKDLEDVKMVYAENRGKFMDLKKQCSIPTILEPMPSKCNGEYLGQGKIFLENTADAILKVLDKRKAKLEDLRSEIEESDLENKEELLNGIDARLQGVDEKAEKIGELKNKIKDAQTREEMKELARLIRAEWKNMKQFLRVSGGAAVADRFVGVLHKTEKLEKKLDRIIDRLEEKGYETTQAQEKINSFNEHIKQANDLVESARAKFAEAKLSPDKNEDLVKDGTELLREAQKHLKLAHETLKEIIKLIKASGENLEDSGEHKEMVSITEPVKTQD